MQLHKLFLVVNFNAAVLPGIVVSLTCCGMLTLPSLILKLDAHNAALRSKSRTATTLFSAPYPLQSESAGSSSVFIRHLFRKRIFRNKWQTFWQHLDRCHTCDFVPQLCSVTLSRDKVAVCNCVCRTLQLCRINNNWPISVHRIFATKLHRIERCANRKMSCATVEKLRDTPCYTCNFVAW